MIRAMRPTEPAQVLKNAASAALREAAQPLRERGWDVEQILYYADESEDHFFDVTLRIRVGHSMPIPKEAR